MPLAESSNARRHLTRVGRCVIDRALVHHLVCEKLMFSVEEQGAELLPRLMGQGDAHIAQQGAPRPNDRAFQHRGLGNAQGDLVQQFQVEGSGFAYARHSLKLGHGGRADCRKGADPANSAFASGLTSPRGKVRNRTSSSNS